jgi:AcrR family transcriptional regulator
MPSPLRHAPRQERSRATVERILAAAAEVLGERGYAAASTNAIAARAGVSPGTLYQYFADKDAIVSELTGRLIANFESALTPVLRQATTATSEGFTPLLIDAVLDALERDADVLRAVVDRVPEAEQSRQLEGIRNRLVDSFYQRRRQSVAAMTDQQAAAAAWLMVEIAQHVAVRYVLDRPPLSREVFRRALLGINEAIIRGVA